ncbi:MAG TPA: hypothetical protein VGM34_01685 [Chlamydiales bacterium]
MSISLQLNNGVLAEIKLNENPPQGMLHWLAQTTNNTKNWSDIAKLGRDFFEWVQETAKHQGNNSLASWAETPIKIFGQATKATLIPFFIGTTFIAVNLRMNDPFLDVVGKVLLFMLSSCLFGSITLGIGALAQQAAIVGFVWYTFALAVQIRNLMTVRKLQAAPNNVIQVPVAPMQPLNNQVLQQLIGQQNKLAMIQVAKAVASWANAVFSELCPAYLVANATLSFGSSLLGVYLLHAKETSQYHFKIL